MLIFMLDLMGMLNLFSLSRWVDSNDCSLCLPRCETKYLFAVCLDAMFVIFEHTDALSSLCLL